MLRQMKSRLFDCSISEMHPGAEVYQQLGLHTLLLTSLHSGRNCMWHVGVYMVYDMQHTTMKTVLNRSPSKAFPLLSYVLPSPSTSFIPCTFLS